MKLKSMSVSDVICPIVEGMVPTIVLLPIINLDSLPKYPISDGSDPEIWYPVRSISKTLA